MSYQEDKAMCDSFTAAGAIYPKVYPEDIEAMMQTLRYEVHVIPNTTTTVCSAILPVGDCDFVIATGETACIDKRNFNPELGAKYARENCEKAARSELWRLEGYAKARDLLAEKKLMEQIAANKAE